uniref:Uncharacterized protein n=1 Tax=Ananas comosus var. bracteatus TaxID=296719 RepID=A0A6V7NSJ9_ANACO|nr:unnamed protein product [Ananas comosus var. bracteatus]
MAMLISMLQQQVETSRCQNEQHKRLHDLAQKARAVHVSQEPTFLPPLQTGVEGKAIVVVPMSAHPVPSRVMREVPHKTDSDASVAAYMAQQAETIWGLTISPPLSPDVLVRLRLTSTRRCETRLASPSSRPWLSPDSSHTSGW